MEKRPYGELGSVSKGNCCCCVSANSGLGEIQPGCGCDEARVDEIVTELKTRMRARGDTAQILRSEETLQRLDQLDAKLVRIKVIERLAILPTTIHVWRRKSSCVVEPPTHTDTPLFCLAGSYHAALENRTGFHED